MNKTKGQLITDSIRKSKMKYQKSEKGKIRHGVANKRYKTSKKGKNVVQSNNLRKNYGITLGQHKQMYIDQNGCCGICGEPVSYEKICVEHRHSDGKIRGLVCYRCNTFTGYIETYPELIEKIKQWIF